MNFEVSANTYGQYMGRYSELLATPFLDFAGAGERGRFLDVGCGPGAATAALVDRVGPSAVAAVAAVAAVDPSESFIAAVKSRLPGVDARVGVAEKLPFDDGLFDLCVAQLAVHFMSEPVDGIREMARVTRPGGTVAACVWDHVEGLGPFGGFWHAVQTLDPESTGEPRVPGSWRGHLVELFEAAGVTGAEPGTLTVRVRFSTFDEWWGPLLSGVGRTGAYVVGLSESRREALREALRERCREQLPPAPFDVSATAWAARGVVAR